MSLSFDTRAITVGELFSGANVFDLPPFQRPYSWEEEHAAQLFDDLHTAYIRKPDVEKTDAQSAEYFLGAIIVTKVSPNAPYLILDGQQRLITISAILAVLRDKIADPSSQDEIQSFLWRPESSVQGLQPTARLRLRDNDNSAYLDWIATKNGTTNVPGKADTPPAQRLSEVIRRLKDDIGAARDDYVSSIARFILNRCQFIVITSQNIDSGYVLFRGVNTPGQPLSEIDLARSELVGPSTSAGNQGYQLAEAWDKIEDEIGIEELGKYIRTVASSVYSEGENLSLGEQIRHITSQPVLVSEFRNKLAFFLSSYTTLDSAALAIGNADSNLRINRVVTCLLATDNEYWRAAALLWLTTSPSPKQTYDFFRALDALCVGVTLLTLTKSKQKKRFEKLKQRIVEGTILTEASSEIFLSDNEKTEIRSILSQPIRSTKKFLKPLLLRINAEMTTVEAKPNFPDSLTIEHVLPRNPSSNSSWFEDFPNGNERTALCESLGNYALLTHRMNARGKNSAFPVKVQLYLSSNDHQAFPITADLLLEKEWTPDAIRRREARLIKIVENIVAPI